MKNFRFIMKNNVIKEVSNDETKIERLKSSVCFSTKFTQFKNILKRNF